MAKPVSPEALTLELTRQQARYALVPNPILETSIRDLAKLIATYIERPQNLIFCAEQRPKD